ncbi:hypothetical protein SS50377_24052 [Spironucleus salmonicida]|uniref:Uncharacterized protein n=1 Tax=Spironucleus salmonicida TaxID=348837 RepID=V6LQ65_9EUKA|nr:hypothetical protein SS50377_24052 [Spironucleus salmonicida]|eukprot:EST46720.1 Hypothetical protein SS50377_13262 [Spironucleus salmonicida]
MLTFYQLDQIQETAAAGDDTIAALIKTHKFTISQLPITAANPLQLAPLTFEFENLFAQLEECKKIAQNQQIAGFMSRCAAFLPQSNFADFDDSSDGGVEVQELAEAPGSCRHAPISLPEFRSGGAILRGCGACGARYFCAVQ